MARAYYGSKISDNITRLSDGCILCHNVPIARTGSYQYLASELGIEGNEIITVNRKPEDVFDQRAIASFEGKAFTDNHPPDNVNVDNWSMYSKGEVKDVRRGKGQDSDKVVADILVRDPIVISEIFSGKREISAGYECEYVKDKDGMYYQKNIIGNHVALVNTGRAGKTVCINDEKKSKGSKYMRVKKLQSAIKMCKMEGK